MKCAQAYKKENLILVRSASMTTAGVWKINGTVFSIKDYDQTELSQAILLALNESKTGIPHPDYRIKEDPKSEPLLQAAGVKSWRMMMIKFLNVSIEQKQNNFIEFRPDKLRAATGPNRGYDFLEDKRLTSDLDPTNLSKALLEAFKHCE